MLTALQKYTGVRYATDDEIKTYNKVELVLRGIDDMAFDALLEKMSDFVFSYGSDRRKAYNRVYRTAKALGLTVSDLDTWYGMDCYD